MSNLGSNDPHTSQGEGGKSFIVENGEDVKVGSYVGLIPSKGEIRRIDGSSDQIFLGVSQEKVAGDGSKTAFVALTGLDLFNQDVANLSNDNQNGDYIYLTTDNRADFDSNRPSSSAKAVGRITKFQSSNKADVRIFSFEESLAEYRNYREAHNVETLSADKTLTVNDAKHQLLDANGAARDVTLPAEEDSDGLDFYIKNTSGGANALTVKDDSGSTIGTVGQNEAATFVCDRSSWEVMGVYSITQS